MGVKCIHPSHGLFRTKKMVKIKFVIYIKNLTQ